MASSRRPRICPPSRGPRRSAGAPGGRRVHHEALRRGPLAHGDQGLPNAARHTLQRDVRARRAHDITALRILLAWTMHGDEAGSRRIGSIGRETARALDLHAVQDMIDTEIYLVCLRRPTAISARTCATLKRCTAKARSWYACGRVCLAFRKT